MNTYTPSVGKIKITVKSLRFLHRAIPLFLTSVFFVYALTYPSTMRNAVLSSLNVCAVRLIPSLFPFMVASDVFYRLGGHRYIEKAIGKGFEKVFALPKCGAGAFVLGALCGLPLGGKYAISLYENKSISKSECERLMGLCNNVGIGFVVLGIGYGTWKSIAFGQLLYITQLFSATVVGILLAKNERKHIQTASNAPETPNTEGKSFPTVIATAIGESAISVLRLCGFVIFFGVICEFVKHISLALGLPELFCVTFSAFTELTYASEQAHSLLLGDSCTASNSAKLLTFFAVGFAGISAHLQLSLFASKNRLSMRKYYVSKLLCGLLCAFTGAVVLHYFDL